MLEISSQPSAGELLPLNEDPAFRDAVAGLAFRIKLSAGEAADLKRQGPLPSIENDRRRFVRFACCARGVLDCQPTLPAIPRECGRYLVLVKNISRSGVCFLHEHQLLPCERCQLWVEGQIRRSIEVARCRRLREGCYEVGARFV
jgi:hypothetical protein